jgi:tetratricopeptide (TPR) repeat protein
LVSAGATITAFTPLRKTVVEYPFGKTLRLALCIFAFVRACHAERGYLVIQVADIHNQPVAGIELATKGSSESGTTDRFGRTRIKLDSQIKVNDWVAMQIVRSPKGKDLVLISPWDAHAQVPPFDNETVNLLPLVVATRGDRALLENGKAVIAMVAQINKANNPNSNDLDPQQQPKEALQAIANAFGLAPHDLDVAIRTWGERASDPYEKGQAALYERNYPLASEELSQSLELREKELTKAQGAAADAAFFLGVSRFEEGKYSDSVGAYQKTQKLRPDDGVVLNNLALSLQYAGDYAAAEPLSRRALSIAEREFGPVHPEVAIRLNNLAGLLEAKGNYAEAETLYRQTLAIKEKVLGKDDPSTATGLINLAHLLSAKGNYGEGETLARRALAIDERDVETRASSVARDLNVLGTLLQQKKDYVGAEPLFRRALAISEKVLGPDHPTTAAYSNNLAELLRETGRNAEAEPIVSACADD